MVSWYFSQIFQINYSKENPLTAATEIAVGTVFVLRSSRSEVVDNCSEKFEKSPRKTSVEVYFSILTNKKHSFMNVFLGNFPNDYWLRFTGKAAVS